MREPPKPFNVARYTLGMVACVFGFVLLMPWIITGAQHYFEWVFNVTRFH